MNGWQVMPDTAELERVALAWIIAQVRRRREMKDTLQIEGLITVPLEWAESLIAALEAKQIRHEGERTDEVGRVR